MIRSARNWLMLFMLVLLAACATTPQTLPITPRPVVSADAQRGAGRSLAVDVIDARDTAVVGLRDATVDGSKISTSDEMLGNIQSAVESGYTKLGFTVVARGEQADITLEIRLTELGYERATDGFIKNLKTGATFEVTSILPGETVNAIYRDGQRKDTVIKPSRAENAEILNRHIDGALAKLLTDRRLTQE